MTITMTPRRHGRAGVPLCRHRARVRRAGGGGLQSHTDPYCTGSGVGPRDMQLDHLELDARPGARALRLPGSGPQADVPFSSLASSTPCSGELARADVRVQRGAGPRRRHDHPLRGSWGADAHDVREVYSSLEARDAAMASGRVRDPGGLRAAGRAARPLNRNALVRCGRDDEHRRT